MGNNKTFIILPTQDVIKTVLNRESIVSETTITNERGYTRITTAINNDLPLTATDFARHTGLSVAHDADTALNEIWLGNRGELRDTVQIYQADANGRHTFTQRKVDTATVGVMPCFLNHDVHPFGTVTTDGQKQLAIGKNHAALPCYPGSAVDANTAAALDHDLQALANLDDRHPAKIGFALVGSYTAPDTGRQCPCYRWHEQNYVLHTNRDGHRAWFRCEPINVRVVDDEQGVLLTDQILFAAPFSNLANFRDRTQAVGANDELAVSQFSLNRYLQDVFLPELIKSTTFGLSHDVDMVAFTHPKLRKLNTTLTRNQDHDLLSK